MSANYLVSRIKEALYDAKGNKARAQTQLIAWAAQDAELLKALTQAHIKGIVAFHVDRVASGKVTQSVAPAKAAKKPQAAAKGRKMVNMAEGTEFARDILRGASDPSAPIFGLESYIAPTQGTQVSERHKDALRQLSAMRKTPRKS